MGVGTVMRMTWRERLADWISGGALSDAWAETRLHEKLWDEASDREYLCTKALRDIAAMETPNANATVKRMVRRAWEALE